MGQPAPDYAAWAIYYVVFLFSTTLHEAAHAWAAKLGGDLTAYHGGQIALSPLPHIQREPFGMVVLPLLSLLLSGWPIGYASAPFDRYWAARHPRRAALMALAGPAANLLLLLLAAALLRAGLANHVFYVPHSVRLGQVVATNASGWFWPGAALMLGVFFSLNLLLALFNLIPLPPLDGSLAISLLMSKARAARYQELLWNNLTLQFFGILIAWQLFGFAYPPVFRLALDLLYPGSHFV